MNGGRADVRFLKYRPTWFLIKRKGVRHFCLGWKQFLGERIKQNKSNCETQNETTETDRKKWRNWVAQRWFFFSSFSGTHICCYVFRLHHKSHTREVRPPPPRCCCLFFGYCSSRAILCNSAWTRRRRRRDTHKSQLTEEGSKTCTGGVSLTGSATVWVFSLGWRDRSV